MDQLLDIKTVSRRLDVAESTVRSWVLRRRIRFVKLGRAVRIPAVAVEELIRSGTVSPPENKAAGQTWANKTQYPAYDEIASLIRRKGDRAYKFVLEQLIPSTRLGDRQGAWRVLWAIHELLQRGKLTEVQRAKLTGLFQVWGAKAEGSAPQRSRAAKTESPGAGCDYGD